MVQAGTKIFPEGGAGAGIVGGKKQSEHEDQSTKTGGTDQNAQGESQTDGKLAISGEEGDDSCVGKNKASQYRNHKGIGALLEELVDPELKAAVKGELGAEDFVLREDQEEKADCDAENGERTGVGVRHGGKKMK